MFVRVGLAECLIVLAVVLVVAGMCYRGGYFRARRQQAERERRRRRP